MTQAAPAPSEAEIIAALTAENRALRELVEELRRSVSWFTRHVFGEKSEKLVLPEGQTQEDLLALLGQELPAPPAPETETITYERRKRKKSRDDAVTDEGLRFDEDVPMETILLPLSPEAQAIPEDRREVIGEKVTYRLAQRPTSHVILKYIRSVIRDREDRPEDGKKVKLFTAPAPANVLERSCADVSFLAGMLVDKFTYHLPLYRQHQRLLNNGITLARSTLTVQAGQAIDLLAPISDAQYKALLLNRVLAMDETPIKAGRKAPGKMRRGQLWPIYGEDDEVVFLYTDSRKHSHVRKILGDRFKGVLLSDGYDGYARYAEKMSGVTLANCWAHARRPFEGALKAEPEAAAKALKLIGLLYAHEERIREKELSGPEKLAYRTDHSLPVMKAFWEWCEGQCRRHDLVPTNPLSKALKYAMERKGPLQVFLSDPDVAIDTNHLERMAARPIAMGRKNWLFCSTEVGARRVAVIQSLLVTCRLQGVDPYVYLVDVLQRVGKHPARDVIDLTPRIWKEKFGHDPLKSDLDRVRSSTLG